MKLVSRTLFLSVFTLSLASTLACDPLPKIPGELPQDPDDASQMPEDPAPGEDQKPGESGGCPGDDGQDPDSDTPEGQTPVFEEVKSKLSRDQSPQLSPDDEDVMRRGNVNLSFDLLRSLNADENLAVSAPSFRQAMGMVYAMSRGETQTEIGKAMGFADQPEATLAGLNAYDLALSSRQLEKKGEQEAVVYRTANRVYPSRAIMPGPKYLDLLAQNFGSSVLRTDFEGQPAKALEEINGWVAQQTNQRIPQLLTDGEISPETEWALVNALYFKAPWSKGELEELEDRDFTNFKGETKKVDMVFGDDIWTYYGKGQDFEWASLPLRGGDLEFMLIVPDKGKLAQVRDSLSSDLYDRMLRDQERGSLRVSFPRFVVDSKRNNLIPYLEAKGVKRAFADADFSGFTDGKGSLSSITFALQSVFFGASETGVEGAAATAVGGDKEGSIPDHRLHVDRPFFFTVLDRPTGLLLFAGQVLDIEPHAQR